MDQIDPGNEEPTLGEGTTQHICALGGFSDKGIGSYIEERGADEGGDITLPGRFVHIAFTATDQLLDFINDDVLPRIATLARYTSAIRVDSHTLFLVHGLAAIAKPDDAMRAFKNTFKGLLQELQQYNSDQLYLLKHGTEISRRIPPEPSLPVDLTTVVYAHGGFDGHNRDS